MSDNTTTIERMLEVLNKLWDAMYESGKVPTYAERAYYYLALKDAMVENAKLRKLVRDMFSYAFNREMELCNACVEANGEYADCAACDEYDGACGIAKKRFEELYADRMRELGVDA